MKEIVLDLAEVTGQEHPNIAEQLVDWTVVGSQKNVHSHSVFPQIIKPTAGR